MNGNPAQDTRFPLGQPDRPRVLVVDDESINVLVLKGMLQAADFDVYTAANGPEARHQARELLPDIILLDIMMPAENGFETCRRLKQDAATTDIPVIFISALTDVENKVQGLELGAVDYITKPFEKAEVIARIRLHLKLKLAHRVIIEEQAAKLRQISEAQQAILVSPADCPEADFAVRYIPAQEAGGDFYDVFPASRKTHCYFVADICGHDLGASFVTSSLKALVRQNSGPLYTPVETMKNINSVLGYLLKDGKFLTAQSCYLNRAQLQLTVVNAGHPPPIHVCNGHARTIPVEGDILGAFETVCLQPHTRPLNKGDMLYLYTDGLVERYGGPNKGWRHDENILLQLCETTAGQDLESALDTILAGLFPDGPGHAGGRDDVILMGIQV